MKAYIIKSQRVIYPFGSADRVYSPMLNYSNLLKEELALEKLEVRFIKSLVEIDTTDEYLLMPDYVFITAGLIKKFLFLCKNTPDIPLRLTVPESRLTGYYTTLMDLDRIELNGERNLQFDVFYLPAGYRIDKESSFDEMIMTLRENSSPVRVVQSFGIRLNRLSNVNGKPYFEEFPLTDEIVGHQRIWFHSLLMNILYLGTYRNRVQDCQYSFGFMHRKKFVDTGIVRNSIIGSNVWIHPTAIIEDSVIADNVRIGASTVIKNSVIMRDANIGDHNIIKYSLLGENVNSLSNSVFEYSVIAPDSTISNLSFCYSMLGRGTFLTTAVIFLYEGINETIKLNYNGDNLDTGRYFLGSAAGDGCVLGTRAIINPGMVIPAQTIIVLRPEEGVMKIPELNETDYYIWDAATIKRFEDVFKEFDKTDYI